MYGRSIILIPPPARSTGGGEGSASPKLLQQQPHAIVRVGAASGARPSLRPLCSERGVRMNIIQRRKQNTKWGPSFGSENDIRILFSIYITLSEVTSVESSRKRQY